MTSNYRVFFGSCGAIAFLFFLRYLASSHAADTPATSMQAAQASANDSRILSGKLLRETNTAASAKMLPTTTKKTGLLLRYCQAITTGNAAIITSALMVSLSPAAHWRQAYHSSAFLDGDADGELYRRFIAEAESPLVPDLRLASFSQTQVPINAQTVHVN